jgi:hypothetical protein
MSARCPVCPKATRRRFMSTRLKSFHSVLEGGVGHSRLRGPRCATSAPMWGHVGGITPGRLTAAPRILGRVGFYLIEIIELFSSVAFDPLDRQETHISCGFLRCLGEARTPPNAQTTPNPPTISSPGRGLRAQFPLPQTPGNPRVRGLLTGLTALPLAAPNKCLA